MSITLIAQDVVEKPQKQKKNIDTANTYLHLIISKNANTYYES